MWMSARSTVIARRSSSCPRPPNSPPARLGHEPHCDGRTMIEAAMIWNEPNNKSHWDLELDPEWRAFSAMCRAACEAIGAENAKLTRVLGGISPIDPLFIERLDRQGALDELDV